MRKLKKLYKILYKNMYVGEGMCVITSELYDKKTITEKEENLICLGLYKNKPREGSLLFKAMCIRRRGAYWWKLNRR